LLFQVKLLIKCRYQSFWECYLRL